MQQLEDRDDIESSFVADFEEYRGRPVAVGKSTHTPKSTSQRVLEIMKTVLLIPARSLPLHITHQSPRFDAPLTVRFSFDAVPQLGDVLEDLLTRHQLLQIDVASPLAIRYNYSVIVFTYQAVVAARFAFLLSTDMLDTLLRRSIASREHLDRKALFAVQAALAGEPSCALPAPLRDRARQLHTRMIESSVSVGGFAHPVRAVLVEILNEWVEDDAATRLRSFFLQRVFKACAEIIRDWEAVVADAGPQATGGDASRATRRSAMRSFGSPMSVSGIDSFGWREVVISSLAVATGRALTSVHDRAAPRKDRRTGLPSDPPDTLGDDLTAWAALLSVACGYCSNVGIRRVAACALAMSLASATHVEDAALSRAEAQLRLLLSGARASGTPGQRNGDEGSNDSNGSAADEEQVEVLTKRRTARPSPAFRCSSCDEIFPSRRRLQRHVASNHAPQQRPRDITAGCVVAVGDSPLIVGVQRAELSCTARSALSAAAVESTPPSDDADDGGGFSTLLHRSAQLVWSWGTTETARPPAECNGFDVAQAAHRLVHILTMLQQRRDVSKEQALRIVKSEGPSILLLPVGVIESWCAVKCDSLAASQPWREGGANCAPEDLLDLGSNDDEDDDAAVSAYLTSSSLQRLKEARGDAAAMKRPRKE